MPKLSVEMFEEAPSVGDKVVVEGKILNIDKDSGEVEVSYDKVTSKDHEKREDETTEEVSEESDYPKDESLDEALGKAFQKNQ